MAWPQAGLLENVNIICTYEAENFIVHWLLSTNYYTGN